MWNSCDQITARGSTLVHLLNHLNRSVFHPLQCTQQIARPQRIHSIYSYSRRLVRTEDGQREVEPRLAVLVLRLARVLVRVVLQRRVDLERVPLNLEPAGETCDNAE